MENVSLRHTFVMERMIVEIIVMSHMNMLACHLHLDALLVNGNVLVFQSDALTSLQFVTLLLIVQMGLMKGKAAT